MKIQHLTEADDTDDFTSVSKEIEAVRHKHVDTLHKKLMAHPHIKDVKVNKAPLADSFKGTTFQFAYKGHPVHAEMSHTGFSLMTHDMSPKHLDARSQLRSMKGLTKHLDAEVKKKVI